MSDINHPGYSEVIAKAWSDPAFKARLKADPAGVLKAAGVPIPRDMKISVVENTPEVMHMVLPLPPEASSFHVALPKPTSKGEMVVRCMDCCTLPQVITNHS